MLVKEVFKRAGILFFLLELGEIGISFSDLESSELQGMEEGSVKGTKGLLVGEECDFRTLADLGVVVGLVEIFVVLLVLFIPWLRFMILINVHKSY